MKDIMIYQQNILNNKWLCHIPETPQAYYVNTKKQAIDFCKQVNKRFESGLLYFDGQGKLTVKK